MYKPHTIEQYKIQQFLDHTFAMEHFLVSPLSRSALMLEDRCGERIAFSFSDNEVREIPIPSAPSPDKVKSFIRSFRALGAKPHLRTFEDVTRWWLNHPNPLTYQQALGLPDELYRRFLSSTLIEDEDAQRLAASGLVSEDAYQDIQLWYLNGNTADCWLGPLGIDGTGNLYAYNGTIPCPHCGRWSEFIVLGIRLQPEPLVPCLNCDCHDPDMGCTMPSIDKSYACPLVSCDDEQTEVLDE